MRVKGPKGELTQRVSPRSRSSSARTRGSVVKRPTDRKDHRALHGLTRTLIYNMVVGVTEGFEKRLEIQGVGYRAQLRGQRPRARARLLASRQGRCAGGNRVRGAACRPRSSCAGIDKQAVGEIAAQIRKARPPEPYKGKGVRYAGEQVARKVGKRA